MQWWESHDQALALAASVQGDEAPALLVGSATLMLHAAGRTALLAESSAMASSRAGLQGTLQGIVEDPLAGCISKSLSDAAGKPMYGPFRAAAMKHDADSGAVALVDALVAAKVPYRDAVAASARSYGIAKRDAMILARVIKSDPKSLTSVAASEKALLLWALRTADAELVPIAKEVFDYVDDKGRHRRRDVNRDSKGRFAPKGKAPAPGSQEEYDQWMREQRERGKRRGRNRSRMAIATAQAQERARPVEQKQQQQAPEQRQVKEVTRQQREQQRRAQAEQQEQQELQELRELRSIRRGRAANKEAALGLEAEQTRQRGYEMVAEASAREVQAAKQQARLAQLMTDLRSEQLQQDKREKIAEAASIASQRAMGLARNITDGEVGAAFSTADPSNTAYTTRVKFLSPRLTDSVVLHVPLAYRPNRDIGFADAPDDEDIFYMYTGKRLPQGKGMMDLTDEDDGYVELLTTASIVGDLHAAQGQKGPKHPLQTLSASFDSYQSGKSNAFFKAVIDQFGGTNDETLWEVMVDGNGQQYYSLADSEYNYDLEGMDLLQYVARHGANITEDGEEYIYPTGVSVPLDPIFAETSMEETMTEADPFLSDAAWRAYAIYQLTRSGDPTDSSFRDYKFNFAPQFVGFEIGAGGTSFDVMEALQEQQNLDGYDYTYFPTPDDMLTKDFLGLLESLGISPGEIEGRSFAVPVVPKTGPPRDFLASDLRNGVLNKETNYELRGSSKMTDEGQNSLNDYRIPGVKPLWSVAIQNDVKTMSADLEQVESMIRSNGMEIPQDMRISMAVMRDLEDSVVNNASNSDPKKVEDFLDMVRILAQ